MLAEDPEVPGEIRAEPVLGTFAREVDSVIELTVGDQVIVTTEDHPFWVPDRGWVEAQDLQVGDQLLTNSEIEVRVSGIKRLEDTYWVYNLDVKGNDTFFVSDKRLLTHNTCGPIRPNLPPRDILMPSGNPIGSPGSGPDIREIRGNLYDALTLFDELTQGGTANTNTNYPGIQVRNRDGSVIGLRTIMSRSPNTDVTLDINIPGIPIRKIKFNP